MRQLLAGATVALNLFSASPNNLRVRSNRFYESLAAGVPVITSNFPAWREKVEQLGCGIVVDPEDPRAIAQALDFLLTHPQEAGRDGARGRQAIVERFNWDLEQQKLVSLYARLIGRRQTRSANGSVGSSTCDGSGRRSSLEMKRRSSR